MNRYMIVGLGNPGREYEKTRHNIGFTVVDALAKAYNLPFDNKKSKAIFADGIIAEKRVLLVKPQTYMNLSGGAVRGLADFYHIEPAQIMVVSDDMDIPLGTLRLRPKGGAGGQKGVRDIIQQLGTEAFPRLRFGIGRPPGRMEPSKYVLQPFRQEEQPLLEETLDRAVRALEDWLRFGLDYAMNRHNGTAEEAANRVLPSLPKSKQTSEGDLL